MHNVCANSLPATGHTSHMCMAISAFVLPQLDTACLRPKCHLHFPAPCTVFVLITLPPSWSSLLIPHHLRIQRSTFLNRFSLQGNVSLSACSFNNLVCRGLDQNTVHTKSKRGVCLQRPQSRALCSPGTVKPAILEDGVPAGEEEHR